MAMQFNSPSLLAVSVALGIGLLIGAERERRKGEGPTRAAAGIRTFAVAALTGVVAMLLGDVGLMAVAALMIGAFALIAYRRSPQDDPGMTTEIALFLTCLIGGLAAREALLAAGLGVALAGLVSGFISSAATIHAMGHRTRNEPLLMPGLVAGAVLSSLATFMQLAVLVGFLSPALLAALAKPLVFGGLAAALYAGMFTLRALRADDTPGTHPGRAFELTSALGFAGLVGAVLTIAAALNAWLGSGGMLAMAAISGLADAHAAAVAAASMFAAEKISSPVAVIAVLAGLTTNTLVKAVLAVSAGGMPYAKRVVPGLVLMVAAAWLGTVL